MAQESFPMNGGDGTYSYAKNSQYQKEYSDTAKGMINEAIQGGLDMKVLMSTTNTFNMVDFGCSVGPNTFLAMQNIIDVVETTYDYQCPASEKLEFRVFFNDHSSNDFNTLFASLPFSRSYFAAGVPGSFYSRLFPSSSIHFAYSSYALHWISRLPEELLDESSPAWNKGRIAYFGANDEVVNAYAGQFEKDMGIFLDARGREIVSGGMMVIIMGSTPDGVIHHSELPGGVRMNFLGSCLMDMVNEGIINESEVDSFNLPIYAPYPKEMTAVVKRNGCFNIERMEQTNPKSKLESPLNIQSFIMHLRAVMEEVFTKHFGSEAVDEMFKRAFQKASQLSNKLEASNKYSTQLFLVLKRI